MENKVQQFLNDNFGEVRVVGDNSKVWFHANDVMKILEYSEGSWRTKISRLRKDGVTKCNVIDSMGREQEANFINEPNLYKLIFGSKMEKAEEFQDWICETVIPSIRHTGGYVEDMREEEFINNYFPSFTDEVKLAMVQDLLKSKKELQNKWDKFLGSEGTYSFKDVSKLISTMANEEKSDISISVVKLTELLRSEGILDKSKSKHGYKNLPNKEYEDYFDVSSVPTSGGFNKSQTKVKAKGVEFIYDLVKEKMAS